MHLFKMQVLSRHWSYFKICSEIYFDSNLFPAEQMSDNIISEWFDQTVSQIVSWLRGLITQIKGGEQL